MKTDNEIIDIVEAKINELVQEDEQIKNPRRFRFCKKNGKVLAKKNEECEETERVPYHILHEKYFYEALSEVKGLTKKEKERLVAIFGYTLPVEIKGKNITVDFVNGLPVISGNYKSATYANGKLIVN